MTETIPVSERLFRYLFEEKGKRVQKIQQTSHARVRMERSPYSVVVSGTKDAVEAAMESLKATEKELLEASVEMEVSEAQIGMLLDKKGALLKKLQTEQKCSLDVDRKAKKVVLRAPEESREEACRALKTRLESGSEASSGILVCGSEWQQHQEAARDEWSAVGGGERGAEDQW